MLRVPRLLSVLLSAVLIMPSASVNTFSRAIGDDSVKVRPYSPQASKEAIKWADHALSQMSLDEKIGQLISVGINATFLNQDSDAFQSL